MTHQSSWPWITKTALQYAECWLRSKFSIGQRDQTIGRHLKHATIINAPNITALGRRSQSFHVATNPFWLGIFVDQCSHIFAHVQCTNICLVAGFFCFFCKHSQTSIQRSPVRIHAFTALIFKPELVWIFNMRNNYSVHFEVHRTNQKWRMRQVARFYSNCVCASQNRAVTTDALNRALWWYWGYLLLHWFAPRNELKRLIPLAMNIEIKYTEFTSKRYRLRQNCRHHLICAGVWVEEGRQNNQYRVIQYEHHT